MPTADHLPEKAGALELLPRLRSYVDPVEAEWGGALAPAPAGALERLSELAGLSALGLQLPASYRSWVGFAGAGDGGLVSETLRVWVDLEDMIEHYEELHRFEPELIQARLPVVASWKIGDELSLDLREAADPEVEPSVRDTSGGDDLGMFAADWESLLFQCAVNRCSRRRFVGRRTYGSSAARVRAALGDSGHAEPSELIAAVLAEHELVLPWCNDARHVYGLGPDIAVLVDIAASGAAPFVVVGDNPKRMRTVAEALAAALGAEPALLDQWV